jgi:hypothetical protein
MSFGCHSAEHKYRCSNRCPHMSIVSPLHVATNLPKQAVHETISNKVGEVIGATALPLTHPYTCNNKCPNRIVNDGFHNRDSHFKPEGPHLGSRSVQNEEHLEPTIQNTGILVNVSECFPKTIEQPNGIHNIVVNIKPNLFQTLFKHIGNQQTYAERLLLRH